MIFGCETSRETVLDYDKCSNTLAPPDHWFVIDTLAMPFNEPIEMEVLQNGDVIIIERAGAIKLYESAQALIKTLGVLPVVSSQSNGLNGIALDPNFENNGFVFFSYTPLADSAHHRISRFKTTADSFYIQSERVLLEIPIDIENGWHGINAMEFDSKGNLYFAIGDFTVQNEEVAGYAQIDERRKKNDSQSTSANTNNLQGKINRIHPEKDGTYTIPEGNLFPDSDGLTKPEIYVMGCRNPYRFILDPHTDLLYFGDVGPDAVENGEKGPRGYDELNIAKTAGYYGWPYLVADNKPYRDFNYKTDSLGPFFDPNNLTNDSPNNSGRKELSPARKAAFWYSKGEHSDFPYLGSGGMNIMVGPKYYKEDYPESPKQFPSHFDGKLFLYDWVRDWIMTIELNESFDVIRIETFLSSLKFTKIIDMKFSPDGTLYLLEYGSSGYKANPDASLKRISYAEGKSPSQQGQEVPANNIDYLGIEKIEDSAVLKLLQSNNCLSCHQVETKLVGPSFKEIAKRYGNIDSAETFLSKKIIRGGTGNWPGNIAMPANPLLKEAQAKEITQFILGLSLSTRN